MKCWTTRVALCAFAVLAIAGCASKHNRTPPREPTRSIPGTGHKCTPGNEALQCTLPPAPHRLTAPRGAVAKGVDFAWGAPTAHRMKATYLAKFGASYLSHDPSKGWTQRPGLVGEYHRAGIATVAVWETSANRAGQGRAAGRADAVEAARQARALGNKTSTIYFAIDFDATGGQVDAYFRGVHSIVGSRAGAYGGYFPLGYLCSRHLIGKAWQTYAWSRGKWLPKSCAPLEQWLNDGVVDYDRAIARDYGQWPPPANPAANRAAKRAALARARHRHAVFHRLIDSHHCRKGQHVTPRLPLHTRRRLHNKLCPRWKRLGNHEIRLEARLKHELRHR